MHPLSVLSLAIFVAGYITARWDLVTRLYELAIFAWDHGVVVSPRASRAPTAHFPPLTLAVRPLQTRAAKGFLVLTIVFGLVFVPVERLAAREASLVRHTPFFLSYYSQSWFHD